MRSVQTWFLGAMALLFANGTSVPFNGHNGEGWTVADWDDSLAAWQDKRVPVSFTVPWDFPVGQAGYIYVDVDWWAEVNESAETDNHIKIMELLHVVC